MPELLSTTEAGKRLGVSAQSIRRYIKTGRLKAINVGLQGRFKIREEDLRKFAEENGMAYLTPEEESK